MTVRCPFCKAPGSGVIESRPDAADRAVWRRRSCSSCGTRWSTSEAVTKGSITPISGDKAPPLVGIQKSETTPISGGALSVRGVGGTPPSAPSPLSLSPVLSVVSKPSGSGSDARKSTAKAKAKAKADPQYSPQFVAFWSVWPRKLSKGDAWRAWQAWGCDADDRAPEIMAVLAWQIPEDFALRPIDRVPYPASWINDRGWENERPTQKAAPQPTRAPLLSWDDQRKRDAQAEAERLLAQRKATVARDLETEQRARERMAGR